MAKIKISKACLHILNEYMPLLSFTKSEIFELYAEIIQSNDGVICPDLLLERLENTYQNQRTIKPFTAETIQEARKLLGLSQAQLAVLLGSKDTPNSKNFISRMETGSKRISRQNTRILRSYLYGYRPPDWPLNIRLKHMRTSRPNPLSTQLSGFVVLKD